MPNGMDDRINERFRDKVTFISGSSKNAGKTTFLNYLLPLLRKEGIFAFLTIGIDGERKDHIFCTDKPQIETLVGDYLLTSENLMIKSDALFEVLQVFPWKTVLGKLLFLKTRRSGLIELAGPENNKQLGQIIEYIRTDCRIESILIDGAVNRVTQIASIKNTKFYYVSKLLPSNYKSSLNKLRVIWELSRQNRAISMIESEGVYKHHGAFTINDLMALDDTCKLVILDDFTKVFLEYSELQKLLESINLNFENTIELVAFVFNLHDIDKNKLLEDLHEMAIYCPIIFNPYEWDEGVLYDKEIL